MDSCYKIDKIEDLFESQAWDTFASIASLKPFNVGLYKRAEPSDGCPLVLTVIKHYQKLSSVNVSIISSNHRLKGNVCLTGQVSWVPTLTVDRLSIGLSALLVPSLAVSGHYHLFIVNLLLNQMLR